MISVYFYATWTIIGVLIILTIITLLIFVLMMSIKFYKLTKLVYNEQQEILGKIKEALNPPSNQEVEIPAESTDEAGDEDKSEETETE